MAYLTIAYNWQLAPPRRVRFGAQSRPRVNVLALALWLVLHTWVLRVWQRAARLSLSASASASAPSLAQLLAALGFLLQSLASVRAGFTAALTSRAALPSLDAALSQAAAHALAALSLVPLRAAPIARIFLAGYASTLYAALLNAYYAYRQERDKNRAHDRAHDPAAYRLRRAKL